MPTYERREPGGKVLERVRVLDGSLEDTRLGLAVLDGTDGWSRVDEDTEP